jgi:phosphoenolpyruvate synthase/pyruvate phosphate dikinase
MTAVQRIHPKIKWLPISSRGRNHAVLLIDSVGLANLKDYPSKIYKINYQARNFYFRQFDGSRWVSEKDYKALVKFFTKEMKINPAFLYKAGSKMERIGLKIIKLVDDYKMTTWLKLSNQELIKILEEFSDLESRLWGGAWIYSYYFFFNDVYLPKVKEILERKLKDDFEKVWEYLLTPEKLTAFGREKLALLKLAKEYIGRKKISKKRIGEHWKKFCFANKYYFWGEGFTLEEIERRLMDSINKGEKYIEGELETFKPLILDLNNFPLSKDEKSIIKGFKKAAYAVNLADEVTNYYTHHLKPLFNEMAARLKISYEELVSMRFEEIKNSINSSSLVVSRKELKNRFKDHALIFAKDKVHVLSGEELEEYRKLEPIEKIKSVREFKGIVAVQNGTFKGKVRVLDSDKKVKFFKEGEILVAPMTNPAYLPAMQKSSAIITDEGGLLCHAAIVSREFNIPCIIGTKIATKVLKDGDKVEVDANRGIVRKIE